MKPDESKKMTEKQIAQRRDDLIRRALKTPPTPLKEMKKKRDPKANAPPSS
jgi:hypothetical protein